MSEALYEFSGWLWGNLLYLLLGGGLFFAVSSRFSPFRHSFIIRLLNFDGLFRLDGWLACLVAVTVLTTLNCRGVSRGLPIAAFERF